MPPYPKAPPLLDRFQVLASTDLDQVRGVTGRLWAEHEVVVRGRVPFRTMINSFQAGETSLSYVDCPTPLRVACASATGQFMVQFNLSGGAAHRINGRQYASDRGRAVIYGPGQDLVMEARPTRALILGLDSVWLDQALSARGLPGKASHQWIAGFDTRKGPGRTLRQNCLRAARELNQPTQQARSSETIAHVENRLRSLLLDCLQELTSGDGGAGSAHAGPARLKALEMWMAAHLHLPLGIDELAKQADLSPRAVQLAFRQYRGITPLGFLRTLRLEEARRRLTSGVALTVGEVASGLGFTHLGRFAIHYHQRFGESPAQTLRKHSGL